LSYSYSNQAAIFYSKTVFFALLLEGDPAPPPATNDVITALNQWFLGQPAILALFSDGQCHHVTTAEETLLPYCTFFKVSDVTEAFTTGYALPSRNCPGQRACRD